MELAYLLVTLLCPLSMVVLAGWWVWSMRRSSGSSSHQAPPRSAAEDAEIARMRAELNQLDAQGREQNSRPASSRRRN